MSDKPELTIHLNMDSKAALAELARIKGKTNEVKEGADQAGAAFGKWGSEALGLLGIQSGLGLVRQAFSAVTQQAREAEEYTKKVAQEFTQLQESLRIVATFKGQADTDRFTVATAKAGAAAGLLPQQWADFEKEFQGYGGQFIGQGKKFTDAQGAELARRAASFMSARGIEASQGASVFGEILQQAKGGESTDELMKRFGQSYVVLEAAKGDPGQLLGQMGQVTAEGVGLQDASKLMRAMAQRDPGEAGTYSRATLRGLRDLRMSGDAAGIGITPSMDIFQQIQKINEAQAKSGKPLDEYLQGFDAFHDSRVSGGVSAAINFGIKGGLFDAADREAAGVNGRTDVDAVDAFRKSTLGDRMYNRAAMAASRMEAGQRASSAADARARAERELTEDVDEKGRNAFQRGQTGDTARYVIGTGADWSSRNDQLIRERAVRDSSQGLFPEQISQARRYARGSGLIIDDDVYLRRLQEMQRQQAESGGPLIRGNGSGGMTPTDARVNTDVLHQLLETNRQQLAVQQDRQRADQRRSDPPLSAPPPNPQMR